MTISHSKGSKYRNKKVIVNGIEFDSKEEAKRYIILANLQKNGLIFNLQLQKKYPLISAQYAVIDGKRKCVERECSYIADFVYKDKTGNTVVEDVKGFKTKEYIIKRKLMLKIYGIRIKEV